MHGIYQVFRFEEICNGIGNLVTLPFRQKAGNNKVLMLLSGGVDSTVCAALISKALGSEQIVAIHIDNGFMRKGESEQVKK